MRTLVAPLGLALVVVLAGCGGQQPSGSPALPPAPSALATPSSSPSPTPTLSATAAVTSATPTASASTSSVDARAFQASFGQLVARIPGRVGIAVAPVGGGVPLHAGTWRSGAAWSTSKVPLAIAAGRSDASRAAGPMRQAIISSDNASAEQLWSQLGGDEQAATRVESVIADLGGGTVDVPAKVSRPGYSAFGQTDWSLESQAAFGSRLPCRAEAGPVLTLMGQISSDQRWGLGNVPGARFKGGWGPGPKGGYLVRQMGIVPTARGDVAVAIAVEPRSGDLAEGTRLLGQVSAWLVEHPELLPTGRC